MGHLFWRIPIGIGDIGGCQSCFLRRLLEGVGRMAPFPRWRLTAENETGCACALKIYQSGNDELTPASLWVNYFVYLVMEVGGRDRPITISGSIRGTLAPTRLSHTPTAITLQITRKLSPVRGRRA